MRNLYFLFCFLLVSGIIGIFSHYLDIEYEPESIQAKDPAKNRINEKLDHALLEQGSPKREEISGLKPEKEVGQNNLLYEKTYHTQSGFQAWNKILKRGKEFIDYYYETSVYNFAKVGYVIELKSHKDEDQSPIRKLHDQRHSASNMAVTSLYMQKMDITTIFPSIKGLEPVYTIQVFTTKAKQDLNFLEQFPDVKQFYTESDDFYRYYLGEYDNYWVCRRQLREIRSLGYRTAFILQVNNN